MERSDASHRHDDQRPFPFRAQSLFQLAYCRGVVSRRLVVIHPPEAAGFGDIAGELSILARAGIVSFDSVPCAFEGPSARQALVAALAKADALTHGQNPPDILMIVRGGGATAGFAALNEEAVARAIGRMSIPVVTGIGHARDMTLADRAAWRGTDTPSKALDLVKRSIRVGAEQAAVDHTTIKDAATSCIDFAGRTLNRVRIGIQKDADRHLRGASSTIEACRGGLLRVAASSMNQLTDQALALERVHVDATTCAQRALGQGSASVRDLLKGTIRAAAAHVTIAQSAANQCRLDVLNAALGLLKTEAEAVGALMNTLRVAVPQSISFSSGCLKRMHKDVLGYGPDTILKRGFALAHTFGGVPIPSAAAAAQLREFSLRFADGSLLVRVHHYAAD